MTGGLMDDMGSPDIVGRRFLLGALGILLTPLPASAAGKKAPPSDIARLEAVLRDLAATIEQLYGAIRANEANRWSDADLVALRPRLMDFGLWLGQLYTGRYRAIATIDDYIKLRNRLVADGQLRVLEQLDLQDAWTALTTTLSAVLSEMIVFLVDLDRDRPGMLTSPTFAVLRKAAQRKAPLVPAQAPPIDGRRYAQLMPALDAYHALRYNLAGTIRLAGGYRPPTMGR
ncbi:MAG: hypothetical protein JWR77_148 [Rhizorhabdus sp.]|nr:hypothetical protein [Rhizorhabdus sp.]